LIVQRVINTYETV